MDKRKLDLYRKLYATGDMDKDKIPEPYYSELFGEAKPEEQ